MFGRMLDLTTKTTLEAVGFYTMSTVVLVGISTVLVHVLGVLGFVSGVGAFFDGGTVHTLIGTGFTLLLGSLILGERKLTGDLYSIILVVLGVGLAFTTSVLVGLIPIAILTTIKSHHSA